MFPHRTGGESSPSPIPWGKLEGGTCSGGSAARQCAFVGLEEIPFDPPIERGESDLTSADMRTSFEKRKRPQPRTVAVVAKKKRRSACYAKRAAPFPTPALPGSGSRVISGRPYGFPRRPPLRLRASNIRRAAPRVKRPAGQDGHPGIRVKEDSPLQKRRDRCHRF